MSDEHYPNLEANHEVREDDEDYLIVVCPFGFETPYSPRAEPDEIDCLLCQHLHHCDEHPELLDYDEVPCADGEEGDEHPLISGSAHGGTHSWSEYAPCKVPLRTINAFDLRLTVHEGIVEDCKEADRRWRVLGGKDFYVLEQWHTGSYSCRNSVGHSRAIAIDFNWSRQGMGPKRTPCPSDPQMPEFFAKCWRPLGYGSGLYWRSKCDGMHVSKVPNEGGDGVLYRTWESAEPTPRPPSDDFKEDVMGKQVLRKGADHADVKILQALLVAWGIEPGSWFGPEPYGHKPDGVFGAGVKDKLIDWQRYVGLKADGVCDSDDWRKLLLL